MRSIVRLGMLVGMILAGQRLWEWQAELSASRRDLDGQRRQIVEVETDIERAERVLDDSRAHIDALAARIGAIEREHPGSIPRSIFPEYQRLLDEHNRAVVAYNDLVARHRTLRDDYSTRVDHHNTGAEAANAVARGGALCAAIPPWLRPRSCDGVE
jgi:hypothetical protein